MASNLPIEEVRLAMALNGGVSLAVWMGGCAVELDSARRAAWGDDEPPVPGAGRGSTRTVYSSLCEIFRRELVIDIMSGASAGGVNGGLLAAAMFFERRLDPKYIREKWLELGDFSTLLHPSTESEPSSLLQGKKFIASLREVFDELADEDIDKAKELGVAIPTTQSAECEQTVPHLDVTVTDVRGTARSYPDEWGGTFSAMEYRRRFQFREEDDYKPRNLAEAARSSASFPVAFEPHRPDGDSWRLTGQVRSGDPCEAPPWTIDGGLLDNAPIRAAIEQIPARAAATREVRRYLVYVNPEPHESLEPPAEPTDGGEDDQDESEQPDLKKVMGYVINLPRKLPFVDQLDAIEDVVQGSAFVSNPTVNLLAMPIRSLRGAAAALLPTYASRRRLRSLQDLLQDPEAVKQAFNVLREARAELPWIPTARGLRDPARWEWGLSTATRVCHFLLDLIRMAIEEGSGDLGLLLEARTRVDQSRIRLDTVLADADDSRRLINALGSTDPALPADEKVTRLEALAGDQQGVALREVRDAISAFGDLLSAMDDGVLWLRRDPEEPVEVGRALFGRGWQADPHFTEVRAKDRRARTDLRLSRSERTCLNRLLAIEVVRRAFTAEEPVDSTQRLSFVQLTPDAPTPIFSRDPLEHPFAASAESKLTGIRMGHFAGFLKRSWRANDFMWGRLDAAARIVDLLVDTGRATQIGVEDVAGDITEVLLGNGPTLEQRCLVAEALDADPDRLRRLKGQLRKKLEEDLATKEAPFTRIVLTRAAQLEIVRAELPAIAEATRKDAVDGSSTKPIDFGRVDQGTGELPPDGVLQGAIDNVRDGQETLPVRLGRDDPAEETSDLTARMAARAGFVTLAALRTAKLPAAQALNVLRPPLLAVRGVAAKGFPLRIPLVLGFWAAALYIAARLVDTSGSADLDAIVWNEILLALVAVLTVIGVAVLPIVRGLRRRWRPVAFAEFAGALAIIAVGGGAAVGLALAFGPDLTPGKLIIGNGFDSPPDWVLGLAIATALGLSLARTPLLGRFPWFQNLSKGGAVSAALLAAVAVLVSVWTVQDLVNAIEQGPAWRTVVALVALVLPWTVCLEYILLHTVPRDSQPR